MNRSLSLLSFGHCANLLDHFVLLSCLSEDIDFTVFHGELKRTTFRCGDRTLDNMMERCRTQFSDRNSLIRRESLERLWDAWERIKSAKPPNPAAILRRVSALTHEDVQTPNAPERA